MSSYMNHIETDNPSFTTLTALLSELATSNVENLDQQESLHKLENLFTESAENLIGDLIRHPEHAKTYRQLGKRLRKLEENVFKQFQDSISSIQRIAFLLRKGKPEELDSFTQEMTYHRTAQSIFPETTLLAFFNLHLPDDLEEVRSIADPEVRARVMAQLINRDRDKINIEALRLNPDELTAINPFLLPPFPKTLAVEIKRPSEHTLTLHLKEMTEITQSFVQESFHTIDYETFKKMEKFCSETEELSKQPNIPDAIREEISNISKLIRDFKDGHKLIITLRELEEILKTGTSQQEKLSRLKQFETIIGLTDIEGLIKDFHNQHEKWERIRKNIFQVSREYISLPLNMRQITWITGNRSAAIIGMEAAAKTALSQRPALVPTGQLLKHNLVPLTGYLGQNVLSSGINMEYLSGMKLRGIETCLLYSTRNDKIFSGFEELKYILGFKNEFLELNRLKIAVLRLILMKELPSLWDTLKDHLIQTVMPQAKDPAHSDQLNDIIKLFDTVKPLDLSEESLSLVYRSFPIVWGSCTLRPEQHEWGEKDEQLVKGSAELGKDIQIVFTDAKHVETLKKAVEKYHVRVLSFDTAKFMLGLT